jgi:O-antigen/teichoic acid export membrane protein
LDPPENPIDRRVLTGTGLHLIARIATALCSLAASALNFRWLGEAGLGRFSFHMNLFVVAGTLVDLGTFAIAVRESARRPGEEAAILRAACRIRIRAIVVCVAALVALSFAVEATARDALLPALAACHLFAIAPATTGAWLQTRVRLAWLALSPVLGMAAWLGGSLLLHAAGNRDPGAFLLAWGAGIVVQSLVPWAATRAHLRLGWGAANPFATADRGLVRELFREAAPLGISSAIATLSFRLDSAFLRRFRDDAAVGRFMHAFQLLSFSVNVPSNLTTALVPSLVRASERAPSEVVRITRRVGAVLAGLCLPVAALAPAWSAQVLWLLWVRQGSHGAEAFELWRATHGDEIASARLLAAAAVAIYLTYPQMNALLALSRQKLLCAISCGALVLKSALSLFTVAEYGVVGAAATTLAVECAVCAVASVALARAVGGAVFSRQLLRPLLPALAAGAIAWRLRDLAPTTAAPLAALLIAAAVALGGALPLRLRLDGAEAGR